MHAALTSLVALLAALALTPAARRLAVRLGAIDHALSSRKIHGKPIPRLGGLAIVGGFYLAVAVVALADRAVLDLLLEDGARTAALLLGGLVIAGLGVHDDLHGATARVKLLVELLVAALLYAAGYRIDAVTLPFLEPIALGWLGLPVTLLWIAGVVNAVNLVDGLDGLAAGVALVAAAATGVLAAVGGNAVVVLLAAALGGAALGFLRANFHPASIFMGDTGSLFLGFVLAATSLRTQQDDSTAVGLLGAVLVLGLPIADTALAMARRALRGAPLFSADRAHLHHRLLGRGLGHRGAVLVLYGVSLLSAAAAVVLTLGHGALDALVLAALAVGCPLALWRLGVLRLSHLPALLVERRRNLAVRAGLAGIRASLRRAGDWGEVWPAVRQAAGLLGADGAELRVAPCGLGVPEVSYATGSAGDGFLCARSALTAGPARGHLELRWSDRAALDRDTEIALELLCGDVGHAAGRLQRRQALAAGPAFGVRAPAGRGRAA